MDYLVETIEQSNIYNKSFSSKDFKGEVLSLDDYMESGMDILLNEELKAFFSEYEELDLEGNVLGEASTIYVDNNEIDCGILLSFDGNIVRVKKMYLAKAEYRMQLELCLKAILIKISRLNRTCYLDIISFAKEIDEQLYAPLMEGAMQIPDIDLQRLIASFMEENMKIDEENLRYHSGIIDEDDIYYDVVS